MITSGAPATYRLHLWRLYVEAAGWCLALGLGIWLRVQNIGIYTGSFDEGIRSQQMLLMAAGYRPFREIFASQGPLLLDLLFPFYLTFGQTLEAVRLGVVVTSIVALVGAGWSARLVAGPIAGVSALAILALSPAFLESSRLALAETPSLAPTIWAIGAALMFQRTGRLGWSIAAGVLVALGVLIKPMVIPASLPVGLLLLSRRPLTLSGAALAVGSAAAVCLAVIVALGPAGVYEDLGAYRGGASSKLGSDAAENWRLTMGILGRDRLAVLGLAAAGALGALRAPRMVLPLACWPLAVAGLFTVYDDLADKHIIYLTFPVAVLAGIGVGFMSQAARELVRERRVQLAGAGAVGLVAGFGYIGDLPRVWRADQYMLHEAGRVAESRRDLRADIEIAEIMVQHTDQGEFVLSDNPNAAFRARRLVPPRLVDTSGTRIDAGSLTSDLAIRTTREFRPGVVVTAPNRLGKLAPFVRWLTETEYELVKTYDVGWRVYVRGTGDRKGSRVKGRPGEHPPALDP